MKKSVKVILVSALLLIGIISFQLIAGAQDYPFENLFERGFAGYTSDEKEVKTSDYVSSKHIEVAAGETVWFGPCDTTQYFQMVGFDANGGATTDKIRGKELEVADTFNNDMVIYKYTVPEGVAKLCFSAPGSVADVYAVAKTEISCLNWDAYWTLKGVSTEEYVGQSSFYKVAEGDKVYFGVITEEDALNSIAYDESANKIGVINSADVRLVESFGGAYGIYCYTVNDSNVKYVQVPYDTSYEQYYTYMQKNADDTTSDDAIVDAFITEFGIQRPVSSTVEALSGKSALFVGDSITYGARDRAKIYKYGSWAGRIGYFCNMDVLNNGVSGACITTARVESHSAQHYIYNNLVAAKDQKFDYVIMHGLFNDASIPVDVGTAKGPSNFDPNSADVTKFASALELLFYTAKTQHPEATLGYIVNFETERAVDQEPYVNMAIQICEDWGIKYLDLFHNKSFSVEFDDGLHPSSAGYDSMYTIVANWMAELENNTADTDTEESTAKVMSYNVYYGGDSIKNKDITISNRMAKAVSVIKKENPDILMLQEASTGSAGWVPKILKLAADAGYGYYGYAHYEDKGIDSVANINTTTASGDENEMTPILWKTDKYDCVDRGHFWASSTPDVPGSTWEGIAIEGTKDYPRCVNWVVLKYKTTEEKILVVSYHADPYTTTIRNLTAQLVAEKVSEISAEYDNLAVVLGGDWNMQRTDAAYSTIISNGFGDAKLEATQTTDKNSYNDWDREVAKFGVGDFLFGNDDVEFTVYDVIDDKDAESGYYISDHSPIMAQIKY